MYNHVFSINLEQVPIKQESDLGWVSSINLSNMKNEKVIDLILKNFSEEILKNEDKISKIFKSKKSAEFKTYIYFKCYNSFLKEKEPQSKTKLKI